MSECCEISPLRCRILLQWRNVSL